MHAFAGWSVWCLVAAMALYFWARIGIDFYTNHPPRYSDCLCALALTLCCTWFLIIYDWNKLHMLWLAMLVLLALAAPSFAARAFSPHWSDRLWARFAADRLDLDMTR
jgi:Na+-driven multidrug efflux pump